MLKIQEYLRSGKTLAELKEEFGIKHNRHGEHPNLVGLKYSQIDSPMGEQIVQECRGLILDEEDNYEKGERTPSVWHLQRIAGELGVDVAMLARLDVPKPGAA